MRPLHLARIATLAAAVALSAGCGAALKSTAPDVTPLDATQAYDVAQQVALSMVNASDAPVTVSAVQAWARVARPPKSLAQPTGMDTTIVGENYVWQVSANLYDADGNEQQEFDPLTSYRLRVASWVHGTWSDQQFSATIGSRGLLDMRGLSDGYEAITTSGSRSDSLDCSFVSDSTSRTYRSVCTGTLGNVVRSKPLAQNPYPLSGTVRWLAQIDRLATQGTGSAEVHWTASALVTFNGTRYVPLVINGVHEFVLDLETGAVTLPVS